MLMKRRSVLSGNRRPDEETIHRTASLLEIDWNQRTDKSYLQVFQEWAAETAIPVAICFQLGSLFTR